MDLPSPTPILLALRLSDEPELDEGETGPLKLECASIDDLPHAEVYVTKFRSRVTRDGLGIVSEIVCAHLAGHFGIEVPSFALIELSSAFAQSLASNVHTPDRILTTVNQNVHNLNFGSRLIRSDARSPLSIETPTPSELQMAEMIFAFDALTYNADRTAAVPNMFVVGRSFVLYDHEKAFNFLFSGDPQPPTDLSFCTPSGERFLSKHLFRPMLKGRQLTFNRFLGQLEELADDTIQAILDQVPYELCKVHEKEMTIMGQYLRDVRNRTKEFRYGVMRVLA